MLWPAKLLGYGHKLQGFYLILFCPNVLRVHANPLSTKVSAKMELSLHLMTSTAVGFANPVAISKNQQRLATIAVAAQLAATTAVVRQRQPLPLQHLHPHPHLLQPQHPHQRQHRRAPPQPQRLQPLGHRGTATLPGSERNERVAIL